jgi:hypothetical protein
VTTAPTPLPAGCGEALAIVDAARRDENGVTVLTFDADRVIAGIQRRAAEQLAPLKSDDAGVRAAIASLAGALRQSSAAVNAFAGAMKPGSVPSNAVQERVRKTASERRSAEGALRAACSNSSAKAP